MNKYINEVPVVKVLKTRDGKSYIFWCPFCNSFHKHGNTEGDRLPHCTNQKSPYMRTGYILKEYTQKEIKFYDLILK